MRTWCCWYSSGTVDGAQRADEMLVRGRHRRLTWFGHLDRVELLDPEDLGERFDREEVRLTAPLHVRHVVRGGGRHGERGVERELVREREHEVVMHDRGHVDRRAGVLGVLVVEHVHVAEAEHGVAHAERGEVHHRVADVTELDVEDGGDPAVLLVELPGVPDDGRLPAVGVDRVAGDPAETEFEERIRALLGAPVRRARTPPCRRDPTARGSPPARCRHARSGPDRARACGRGSTCTRPSPRRAPPGWRARSGPRRGRRPSRTRADRRSTRRRGARGCRLLRGAAGSASRARAGRAARRRCGHRAPSPSGCRRRAPRRRTRRDATALAGAHRRRCRRRGPRPNR